MTTANLPPAGELWVFTFRALPDDVAPEIRVRRLLKYAGRSLRLKCTRVSGEDEIARLQGIIESLADRCARQAELLARRAGVPRRKAKDLLP